LPGPAFKDEEQGQKQKQEQPQVPFGDAQGRLSTPLRFAQNDSFLGGWGGVGSFGLKAAS
jgi:hypothetical protein